MPAFGFLLIIVGIFVLINTLNGNLPNVILGKTAFNFGPSSTSSTPSSSNTIPTTAAASGKSGLTGGSAGQGIGGGGGSAW